MRHLKDTELAERRDTAASAKAAMLQAYRAATETVDPTRLARQAEREAVARAREARQAEKALLKAEAQARLEAEKQERQAAIAAAAQAEAEQREAKTKSRAAPVLDEAARKAERDRRYANRKVRQR